MIKEILIVGLGSFAGGALRYVPLLLMTGVLGGFTTFSTSSLETIQLLQQNEYLKTILYVVGSAGLGLTACFWGIRQF